MYEKLAEGIQVIEQLELEKKFVGVNGMKILVYIDNTREDERLLLCKIVTSVHVLTKIYKLICTIIRTSYSH